MPSLRVAPENKDTVPKRKKLVRRRSTKRWWLTDEAKKEMKNEFDSLVQLTERDHQGVGCMLFWNQDHGVINPHSNFVVVWDIMMLVLILVISFTVPYETGFLDADEDSGFFYLNRVTDVAFAIDLLLNFFLPIKDAHTNNWVFDRKIIMRKYLTGYFAIDALSLVPFDIIASKIKG